MCGRAFLRLSGTYALTRPSGLWYLAPGSVLRRLDVMEGGSAPMPRACLHVDRGLTRYLDRVRAKHCTSGRDGRTLPTNG